MNSLQIRDKKATLKKRGLEIIETAKKEVRDLTDAETVEIQEIKDQMSQLDEEMKALNERLQNLRFDDDEEDAEKETPSEEDTEDEEEDNKEEKSINRNMKKENFSLVRAIRAIANNQQLDAVSQAVINRGAEEARKAGVATQGQIQLPLETRATVSVDGAGDDIVATDLFDLMTPLRAKNVLVQAGAKFMTGLVGDCQIPLMSENNVFWGGELSDAQDGSGSFSHATLSPCRLTCYVDVSKMLLAQNSIDIENAIRNDLIAAINTKLEQTILGDGDGKEGGAVVIAPEGIFHAIEATEVSDFAGLCDLEADVEDANVLGECKYVMSNKAKAALRGMTRGGDSTRNVFEDGTVDGTAAFNTSNVDDTNFIYGDFSNLAIGSWGGVDIVVDPYTKAAAGQVRIVVNAFFDAKVLRSAAFATGTIVSGE